MEALESSSGIEELPEGELAALNTESLEEAILDSFGSTVASLREHFDLLQQYIAHHEEIQDEQSQALCIQLKDDMQTLNDVYIAFVQKRSGRRITRSKWLSSSDLVSKFGDVVSSLSQNFVALEGYIARRENGETLSTLKILGRNMLTLADVFVYVHDNAQVEQPLPAPVTRQNIVDEEEGDDLSSAIKETGSSQPTGGGVERVAPAARTSRSERVFAERYYTAQNNQSIEDIPDDAQLFTMGINPSKRKLHEGHWLILFQLAQLLQQRPETRGLVFVDDREFDFQKRLRSDERIYSAPHPIDVSAVDNLIGAFFARIASQMGQLHILDRVNVLKMSRYMSTMEGHEYNGARLYKLLVDNRKRIKLHFDMFREADTRGSQKDAQTNFVRPLCEECKKYGPRFDEDITVLHDRIRGVCNMSDCAQGEAFANPSMGDNNWTIHYAVDPLRDAHLSQDRNAVICHLFGGDYGMEYGRGGTPKALRLNRLIQQTSPDSTIYHFTGPLLMRGGEKLSKRDGDYSDMPDISLLEDMLKQHSASVELGGESG